MLVQLLLWYVGMYKPVLSQPTFIVLVFGLALATSIEYKELRTVLWVSFLPAFAAVALYTAYLLTQTDPTRHEQALILGFYFWLWLVALNVIRVLAQVVKQLLGKSS